MSNFRYYPHAADTALLTRCVIAAAEVQDRMREADAPPTPPMFRRLGPPPPRTLEEFTALTIRDANFDAHERAVVRALLDRFPLSRAVEMVLRARKAGS